MTHNFRLWALSFCSSTTCSASLGTWPLSPWPCWISTSRPPCISSSEMSPYHKFHSELSVYPSSWPPLLQEIKQSLSDCMAQLLLLLFLFSWESLSFIFWLPCPMTTTLPSASRCITWPSWIIESAHCLSWPLGSFILNHIPISNALPSTWLL